MKINAEVLAYARSHPFWDEFEKFLLEQRPIVPTFNPDEDNTAQWKHACAKREGFDLALHHLKIEVNKNE